jgi:Nucleotide-diphospho-sugar transferase
MGDLSKKTKDDIQACVESLNREGPVVVAAASDGHAQLLDNWICHMASLGIERLMVIAMDEAIAARLGGSGLAIVRASFDGSIGSFWLQRARVFASLADEGIEFIHSDTDAVWLRNPIPRYAGVECDMMFSQGTVWPQEAVSAWGFVLCCGFFWARPTPATRMLMQAVVGPYSGERSFDDQIVLNRLLVAAGTSWEKTSISYTREFCGSGFTCYRERLIGTCQRFGARIALLPHHEFPRLHTATDDAFVRHILTTGPLGSVTERVELLRADNCWKLDDYPNGFLLKH